MGANERTLAALDAILRDPQRYFLRDIAFLPFRRRSGKGAVDGQRRDRDIVARAIHHLGGHVADEIGGMGGHGTGAVVGRRGCVRHVDARQAGKSPVNGGKVLLHHLAALFGIGLLDCLFDLGDGRVTGHHP